MKGFQRSCFKAPSLHIYEEVFKYYVWMGGGDLSQNAAMADIVSDKILTLEFLGSEHNSG